MEERIGADGIGVVGGVDTHRDTHVGAVVDTTGRLLGSAQFRADATGYGRLVAWMESWGRISRVGVEGTGNYVAGGARTTTSTPKQPLVLLSVGKQPRFPSLATDRSSGYGCWQ